MENGDRSRRRSGNRALKQEYGALFAKASALLRRVDPIGIGPDAPASEYEPEVGTILPRLARCRDASQVQDMVHEEFSNWFSPELAGPREAYRSLSVALWDLWQSEHRGRRDA